MKVGETHLSTEAICAFVDGQLSDGARNRAVRHVRTCFECAYAVGIQQQAKESLTRGGGDLAVPSALLSKLGQIPFSAELEAGRLEDVGLYADEAGRFAFRVAAPADPQRATRSAFGGRRGRPGHQMPVGGVVSRHTDQSPDEVSR